MTWKKFLTQLATVLAVTALERLVIDSPLLQPEPVVKPARHEAESEPSKPVPRDLRDFISSLNRRGVPGM